MNMEEICGKKPGTTIYVYNDYTYNKDSRNPNILRCNTRRSSKCSGTLKIDNNGEVRLVQDHTHIQTKWKVTQFTMKQEMLQLCRDTASPLKEIFDNVCRKYPEIAATLSYATLKPTLYRERIKLRPSLPKDMETLIANVSTYEPLERFYKGNVTCRDGKKALIFSSNDLLQELQTSTELYVDGTFNIVPRVPMMSQMYTLHIRHMNVGIATIFILSESRSSNMYRAIWNKVIELVPMIRQNLKFIMSDYEMAAMKVINEQFPAVETHGCWFHYNQALLRRWRRLGLTDAPRIVLSMTMTMALAPSNCFEEALSFIQFEADQISHEYPTINDFLAYVRKTWLPLASKVSVYDCPVRTNNITESFHNVVGRKFSKAHENVWNFLDNLRKLIIDEELKLKRLKTTETNGHRTSIKNKNRDNKILEIQKYFAARRLPLNNFLRFFSDGCENIVKKFLSKECNSHSTSDEDSDRMYSETNTLQNTENNAKINVERIPLQELNCDERNSSRVECHKRKQEVSEENTDKENLNGEYKNSQKQNKLPKLRELHVALQRIDEVPKEQTVKRINH
ncbi:uncharacterized protein [Temnothorax longispinosus]|uniref:uncharacterized protein isoform X2 n=1 Tax=Temnothorax longispinosus TaxID=300112 RepID=UPI003A98EDDB